MQFTRKTPFCSDILVLPDIHRKLLQSIRNEWRRVTSNNWPLVLKFASHLSNQLGNVLVLHSLGFGVEIVLIVSDILSVKSLCIFTVCSRQGAFFAALLR